MKLLVFAIYDEQAGLYAQPFYSVSRGTALRSFQTLVEDPQSSLHKHPKDFHLYELGSYEDNDGKHVNLEHVSRIASAIEYVRAQAPRVVPTEQTA